MLGPVSMPDASPLYLKVRAVIAKKAGEKVGQVKCPKPIGDYLTDIQKRNLAPRFQQIAREYQPGAVIGEADTAALDDVLSAYNLVGQRAGFPEVACNDVPPLPQ